MDLHLTLGLCLDDRVVKGETASGAVYLMRRKPRELPGLVALRRSYRSRIVLPVLGPAPDKAGDEATE